MKTTLLILAAGGVTLLAAAAPLVFPWAKLTVRVLDDDGKPLECATVRMGFQMPDLRGSSADETKVNGDTNAQGEFSGAAECSGRVSYWAEKDGYYLTSPPSLQLRPVPAHTYWTPWNPVQVIGLKKIIHPVPMYAWDRLSIIIPKLDTPAGYDLIIGDWVAPYGRGQTADFIFRIQGKIRNELSYSGELTLSFSQPDDGILRLDPARTNPDSELRSPQVAPAGPYAPVLKLATGAVPTDEGTRQESQTSREDDTYVFRVRSRRGPDGAVVQAWYGKIYGPIRYRLEGLKTLGPPPKGTEIFFSYYLNPDPDSRSLEFDLKRNLFSRLRESNQPNRP